MKLNQDCVRDLMLYFEENTSYSNDVYVNSLPNDKYSDDDLVYAAEKLDEAGFINCVRKDYSGEKMPIIVVKSITYSGHNFLDNIRDNSIWKKTKSILKPLKSISVELISETASKIIVELINQKLENT